MVPTWMLLAPMMLCIPTVSGGLVTAPWPQVAGRCFLGRIGRPKRQLPATWGQELPGEVAASQSDCGRFQDASINEDSNIFTQVAKLCSCPVGKHLCWVICGDVSTEQFGHGCLFDASTHCFDNFWDAFIDLAKDLIPLKRVILEEVSTLPECIASFAARFVLQALLGFNDGTNYNSSILCSTSKDGANEVTGDMQRKAGHDNH